MQWITPFIALAMIVSVLYYISKKGSKNGKDLTFWRWLRQGMAKQGQPSIDNAPNTINTSDGSVDGVTAVLEDIYAEFTEESKRLRDDVAFAMDKMHQSLIEEISSLRQELADVKLELESYQRARVVSPEAGRDVYATSEVSPNKEVDTPQVEQITPLAVVHAAYQLGKQSDESAQLARLQDNDGTPTIGGSDSSIGLHQTLSVEEPTRIETSPMRAVEHVSQVPEIQNDASDAFLDTKVEQLPQRGRDTNVEPRYLQILDELQLGTDAHEIAKSMGIGIREVELVRAFMRAPRNSAGTH